MTHAKQPSSFEFGRFRLIPERRLLEADGQPVTLRVKVFDLLWYLVQHRGRLVEKSELLAALWPDRVVEENNLNQAVSALRRALGDTTQTPRYVATVKGRGFQFIGDVRVVDGAAGTSGEDELPARRRALQVRAVAILATVVVVAAVYLAYQRQPGELAAPVVLEFDAATLELITDAPGAHSDPALSPDGTMLAYVSNADGSPQIRVRNLRRGEPIRITDGPYPASSPSWSPDNDEILYARLEPGGPSIFSVGPLGTPPPRRIVERGSRPRYALASDAFVYVIGRSIWLARNDGRDVEAVDGIPVDQGFEERMPSLSPDGRQVAFIHAEEGPFGNLWVIPATGGVARQLTTREALGGYAASPVWTGDGRHIVVSVNAGTGRSQLSRVAVDSGEITALTSGPGGADRPAVSADGTRLVFTSTRTVWRLTRVEPESGRRSTILESRNPILLPVASPDGHDIAFFSALATGTHLFAIEADGSGLRQLTFDENGENTLPAWAGDGKSLFYYRDRALHRLFLPEGPDREVLPDFHWSTRTWLAAVEGRITYHEVDRRVRHRRTVVRELDGGEEFALPVPIEGANWSADGSELIGFDRRSRELVLCRPDEVSCRPIEHEGESVTGLRPLWARSGEEVFYLRRTATGECCSLWRVDRDGRKNTELVELEGYDMSNSHFGIDGGGAIFYNHVDRSTDEIWLAEHDGTPGTRK